MLWGRQDSIEICDSRRKRKLCNSKEIVYLAPGLAFFVPWLGGFGVIITPGPWGHAEPEPDRQRFRLLGYNIRVCPPPTFWGLRDAVTYVSDPEMPLVNGAILL